MKSILQHINESLNEGQELTIQVPIAQPSTNEKEIKNFIENSKTHKNLIVINIIPDGKNSEVMIAGPKKDLEAFISIGYGKKKLEDFLIN